MATGYWCPDCMELTESIPVYECSADGWEGTERRCETCNKFVSRREDDGCENCFSVVEEVEVVTDHDGALIKAEDFRPNGKSLAERTKAAEAKSKRDAAKKAKSALDALLSATQETTWSSISVGQKIVAKNWKGEIDTMMDAKVLSIMVAGDNCVAPVVPGSLIVLTDHYGLRVEAHTLDEQVLVKASDSGLAVIEPAEDRFVVQSGSDTHGSSVKYVSANVSLAPTAGRDVYMGEISGKNALNSGYQTMVGAFFEPHEARAFAATARKAAAELRTLLTVDDTEVVSVELTEVDDIMSHNPTRYATFVVGSDESMGGVGARIYTGNNSRTTQSYSVASPSVLDGIAKAADMIADKLAALIDLKEK